MKPYCGYIFSRPFLGNRAPQHVQNLLIREHVRKLNGTFRLSATEYAMPDSHMMLRQLLNEAPGLAGIVAYSLFQLPPAAKDRLEVYRRVLEAGSSLHFALENLSVVDADDARRVEDVWLVQTALLGQCG